MRRMIEVCGVMLGSLVVNKTPWPQQVRLVYSSLQVLTCERSPCSMELQVYYIPC